MSPKLILTAATAMCLALGSARADLTITVEQDGSNVVATGGGTINLTDLTGGFSTSGVGAIIGSDAFIQMGSTTGSPETSYSGITGPASFGSGLLFLASSGTGDIFSVNGNYGGLGTQILFLPKSYISGTPLTASDTYTNQSISSLGLSPGTYTWTWGSGSNADSFTVQIGPAATGVPEPSTAIVAAFGAVAFLAYGCYRRREQPRQAAA